MEDKIGAYRKGLSVPSRGEASDISTSQKQKQKTLFLLVEMCSAEKTEGVVWSGE